MERLKSIKNGIELKEMELQKELNEHLRSGSYLKEKEIPQTASKVASPTLGVPSDVLWEAKSELSDDPNSAINNPEMVLDQWAEKVGEDEEALPSETLSSPPVSESPSKQTHVLITVSGWVAYDQDDHTYPFSTLEPGLNGDQYSLIWETKALQELGSTMSIFGKEIASFIFQQGLQVTLLPALLGALTGPMWLLKLTYLVDNPWGNALSKAEKAGRLLADTLIGQVQSNRPVTLVGFSLGARLIYYCLLELAARNAFGIIETVYLMGTPCVSNRKEWENITSVVSGKIFNCYTPSDTVLGVLYRASIASYKDIPGLSPIHDVPGIQNIDVTNTIKAHMEYVVMLPRILEDLGFVVSSHTFEDQDTEATLWKAEIEDAKQKEKERKEEERLAQMEQVDRDREVQEERRRRAQEAELERKRLAKEAALAEKKRQDAEKARKSASVTPKESPARKPLSLEDIAREELAAMQNMEKMMSEYWTPREITSTLPPLVISTEKLNPVTDALFAPKADESNDVTVPEEELSDF
jgi:hypothetical protein